MRHEKTHMGTDSRDSSDRTCAMKLKANKPPHARLKRIRQFTASLELQGFMVPALPKNMLKPPGSLTAKAPVKWMGKEDEAFRNWDSLFSGAMLNFGGVYQKYETWSWVHR